MSRVFGMLNTGKTHTVIITARKSGKIQAMNYVTKAYVDKLINKASIKGELN